MLPLLHSQSLVPARRPRSSVLCHFRSFSVLVCFMSSLSLAQISFVVIRKGGFHSKEETNVFPHPSSCCYTLLNLRQNSSFSLIKRQLGTKCKGWVVWLFELRMACAMGL